MAGTWSEFGKFWLNVPAPHLHSGTSLGKAPRGLQTPKHWLGDELEGVEEAHPKLLHLAVGDQSQQCLVVPKIGSSKRGASSLVHKTLFLHCLVLGRLLEMCISLLVRMNSVEPEGLLTVIPGITGSHSQSKLFVFTEVSG